LPSLWADPYQLEQVLLNIFSNAAHAMKSAHGHGLLAVRTRRHGAEAQVEIADDGPGIPEEHLSRIFDPFFTTKPAGEGTGLGLSLTLGIVAEHGGRITAANGANGGARFVIALPFDERAEVAPAPSPKTALPLPPARVLVVDDELSLRRTLGDVLRGLGQQVDEAATGREALARLDRATYDLIALDLRLPDMHGRDVWDRVLERSRESASRVIFMTGETMSVEAEEFLTETGRPVLRKPFTIDEIQEAFGAVLRQAAPVSSMHLAEPALAGASSSLA